MILKKFETPIQNILHEFGGTWIFLMRVLQAAKKYGIPKDRLMEQVSEVSLRTVWTVLFAGLFVGAILVLQFEIMLKRFDATTLLGGLNTSATLREVGPLIISFLLAGKIGAFTTAELANMRVTEQIEAIEGLGTHSISYLIVPRFYAIILSSISLLAIGLLCSVVGAIGICLIFTDINLHQYLASIPRFAGLWTLFEGLFRSTFFAIIVATVSTYKGYYASGGARGVGRAVTESAIYTNVYIVMANFVSSSLLEWVHDFLVMVNRWMGLKWIVD